MRFASLGSGSAGNATLVESGDTCLLIDCGFSLRETERRLQRLGRCGADLAAILVTHEHGDHVGGVAMLARKYGLPVYASAGTVGNCRRNASLAGWPLLQVLAPGRTIEIDAIEVLPVPVPHDAGEPCQFVFRQGRKSFGLLTDLGTITPLVAAAYQRCDALLLECNHDPAMLASGPYPGLLKRRVGGPRGHLNNGQAAALLGLLDAPRLQVVAMAHLSRKNNTEALARAALAPQLGAGQQLCAADQEQGLGWREVV